MAPDRPRSALPLLLSVVVVDLIGFGIVMPVLPFYAREFGAGGIELGIILTAHAGMQFLFARVWGRLSDRIGRRLVLLLTIAGTCLSLLLLGLADSLATILVARLLSGAFAANVSVAGAYISDVTSDEERTRWLGLLGVCFAVGFTLGPGLGGLLAPFGPGVPMLFAAGLAAVNFVHAFFSLAEPPTHSDAAEPVRAAGPPLPRDPEVRRVCLVHFGFAFAVAQLESMFPFYLADRFGFDARALAFLMVGLAVLMGGVQGGAIRRLVGRFGERRLVIAGFAALATAFAFMPFPATWLWMLLPLALSAVARAMSQPSLMGLVSFSAGDANRGDVMGSFQAAGSLARTVGPLVAGALYDLALPAPFALAAIVMAVTLVPALGLRAEPTAVARA